MTTLTQVMRGLCYHDDPENRQGNDLVSRTTPVITTTTETDNRLLTTTTETDNRLLFFSPQDDPDTDNAMTVAMTTPRHRQSSGIMC